MVQDGKSVLRCTALLLRSGQTPALPAADAFAAATFAPPEEGAPIPAAASRMSPFFAGVDVRMARGQILEPGPAAAWLRLGRPLVDAEAASPLAQVASAADLVAGISQWAHPARLGFVNADLTINLRRSRAATGCWWTPSRLRGRWARAMPSGSCTTATGRSGSAFPASCSRRAAETGSG